MKTKKDKQKIIQDLKDKFQSTKGFLIINLLNLDTLTQNKLKTFLKNNNAFFQVAKKTLVYKANPNFPFKDEELKFPFAFVWNFDDKFSSLSVFKNLKNDGIDIKIVKGYLWNQVFSEDEIQKIIDLPSKDELIIKLIQNLKGQIYKLNFSLKSPIRKLIFIMSNIKK